MARSETSSPSAMDEKNGMMEDAKPTTYSLTEDEQRIIDVQLHVPSLTMGYFSLFQFASRKDFLIMAVAALAAIVAGAVLPLVTLVYGNFAGSFASITLDASAQAHYKHQISTFSLYFVYLGVVSLVTVFVSMVGFSYTGERITQQIRELYLKAIFRQNVAFFDFVGAGEITTRISSGTCSSPEHQAAC
jgi:ATP-binding cassette subfamily B (MDR/TAP) protein 1